MAPKQRHQQQHKKKNNPGGGGGGNSSSNPSPPPPSKSSAPKLALSGENERKLRQLLLLHNTNKSSNSNGVGCWSSISSVSLSREQKWKRLCSLYENLSCEGFLPHQIEQALSSSSSSSHYSSFESALDWLCLNIPPDQLPLKFSSPESTNQQHQGSINVISTAQHHPSPPHLIDSDNHDATNASSSSNLLLLRAKGRCRLREENDNDVDHEKEEEEKVLNPSQSDWIRRYMEQQEEEEEDWSSGIDDFDGSGGRVINRNDDPIDQLCTSVEFMEELEKLRLNASEAKSKGDRKGQEIAGDTIRRLKQRMSVLGLHLPDKVTSREFDSEHQLNHDSSELESALDERKNNEEVEENDTLLDSLFSDTSIDVHSSNSVPVVSVSMRKQAGNGKSAESESKWSSKGKKKKEDVKPSINSMMPKALLQQQCQKSGWEAPKYAKLATKENGKYRYSVSVIRPPTGRGKSREAGGLINFSLPDEFDDFESVDMAQDAVASYALFHLFPDPSLLEMVAEPYLSMIMEMERAASVGQNANNLMEDEKMRREVFINSLLDATNGNSLNGDVNASVDEVPGKSAYQEVKEAKKTKNKSDSQWKFVGEQLKRRFVEKGKSPNYNDMLRARSSLPIAELKEQFLSLLDENDVVVVCGETGCGKTTQVPQFILEQMVQSGKGGACNIICTQPRRIAAITVAERVANELCEPLPGSKNSLVGYQVRLESAWNDHTKLLFCTTGILLRKLNGDRHLNDVSHVIVDEVHERTLLGDFLLIVLRDLIEQRSIDPTSKLKVILMSATADASMFSKYFGNCPIITAKGRTHPVSTYFLENVYEMVDYRLPSDSPASLSSDAPVGQQLVRSNVVKSKVRKNVMSGWGDESLVGGSPVNPHYNKSLFEGFSDRTRRNLKDLNEDVIDYDLLEELVCFIDESYPAGAILVFLPGMAEISNLVDRLSVSYRFGGVSANWILPLHSSLSSPEQQKVFASPPENVRKIIVATDIAETSITIDDVVYVIDCGKHKEKSYNPKKKMSSITEQWVSQASAKQRCGRAGRVQPGVCYRLYTRQLFEERMHKYQVPEILRMPLEELCLQIKFLSLGDIKSFLQKAIEPPKEDAIDSAVKLLYEVGAFEGNESLTPLGQHLAKLPVDVKIGKMMIYGCIFGCLSPILSISAFISYNKSPFMHQKDERQTLLRAKLALLTEKQEPGGNDLSDAGQKNSDHLLLAVVYSKWFKVLTEKGERSARSFCKTSLLNSSTMYMIREMRVQFGGLLADIGLITLMKSDAIVKGKFDTCLCDPSQPFNLHSKHSSIIKSVLCAGLYPNIAALKEGMVTVPQAVDRRQSSEDHHLQWYDKHREVYIHPSSVNNGVRACQHPFLAYLEKVETGRLYLRDTTIVSPYCILLFGGSLSVQHKEGLIIVDGWLKLAASAQTAVLLKELRSILHSAVKEAIYRSDLSSPVLQNDVVKSIIHLLLEEGRSVT